MTTNIADATPGARSRRWTNTETPLCNAKMLVGLLEDVSRADEIDCWMLSTALDALREERKDMGDADEMGRCEALLEALYDRMIDVRTQQCMEVTAKALLEALKAGEVKHV